MKVIVIQGKFFNNVHIRDGDGGEIVLRQSELTRLIKLLKKARGAKGIPREEFDEHVQLKD